MVSVCLFVVLFYFNFFFGSEKHQRKSPTEYTDASSLCAFHMAICSSRGHNWSSPTTIKPSCSSGILSIYRRVLLSESASGIASFSFLLPVVTVTWSSVKVDACHVPVAVFSELTLVWTSAREVSRSVVVQVSTVATSSQTCCGPELRLSRRPGLSLWFFFFATIFFSFVDAFIFKYIITDMAMSSSKTTTCCSLARGG